MNGQRTSLPKKSDFKAMFLVTTAMPKMQFDVLFSKAPVRWRLTQWDTSLPELYLLECEDRSGIEQYLSTLVVLPLIQLEDVTAFADMAALHGRVYCQIWEAAGLDLHEYAVRRQALEVLFALFDRDKGKPRNREYDGFVRLYQNIFVEAYFTAPHRLRMVRADDGKPVPEETP